MDTTAINIINCQQDQLLPGMKRDDLPSWRYLSGKWPCCTFRLMGDVTHASRQEMICTGADLLIPDANKSSYERGNKEKTTSLPFARLTLLIDFPLVCALKTLKIHFNKLNFHMVSQILQVPSELSMMTCWNLKLSVSAAPIFPVNILFPFIWIARDIPPVKRT